jgi:hypothetical protein
VLGKKARPSIGFDGKQNGHYVWHMAVVPAIRRLKVCQGPTEAQLAMTGYQFLPVLPSFWASWNATLATCPEIPAVPEGVLLDSRFSVTSSRRFVRNRALFLGWWPQAYSNKTQAGKVHFRSLSCSSKSLTSHSCG